MIPDLEGEQRVEGIVNQTRSNLWTEKTNETMSGAELALALARQGGFAELEAVATGLLGSAHGMRGDAGDLERAIRLTDQAVKMWIPNTRQRELAEVYHFSADHCYWAGDYERAIEASALAAATAGVEMHSQEYRLRGAGMQAIILSGIGRYEDAISAAQDAIELARTMGRKVNVVTNYSTLPLREIFAVDEALTRSEEVEDRLGPSDFNMPWMNARADVFVARVMKGDTSRALRDWGPLWDDAVASKAWERWLVSGRMAAVRADLELDMGNTDDTLLWGGRAIEMAVASSRKKYEAIARTTVGRALTTQRLHEEAVAELRRAAALSDVLGSPLIRWQSRAALAQALPGIGSDPASVCAEAADIIRSVVAGLTAAHADGYLAVPQVVEVLDAVR